MADTTRRIIDIADNQEIDMGLKDLGSSVYADKVHLVSTDVSIAGGTEYTEGATDATITGSAILWEDTADTLRVPSAAKPLPVEIITGGAGGTQYDEDTVSTAGDKITMAGVVRKDTAATLVGTDGDRTQLQVDAEGRLHTNGSGVTQPVSGTVTANAGSGTFAVADAAAEASLSILDDWDESDRAKVNPIAGQVGVQGGTGASTALTQRVNLATDGNLVQGDVAHDAADTGNPAKIGAKATTALHSQTPVAAADRTNLVAGADGVLITRDNSNLESMTSASTSNTDGASTSLIAAAGAGIKWYITDVIISNSSSTFCTVDLRDGTGGAVKATFPVPATGGVVHRFATPLAFTANTAVAFDASAATTTLNITALGFKAAL